MNVIYHHRTAGDRVERVHIMGIVQALRGMGHRVWIASPPGCEPELKGRASSLPSVGVVSSGTATGLRARLKGFARKAPPVLFEIAELLYNFYSMGAMLRICLDGRRRPGLIYERMTANSIAPTLLAKLLRIPIVQEVNVTADVGRLRPLVLGRLTRALERWVFRHAAQQITVSRRFRQLIIDAGLPGARDAIISPNAVSAELFGDDVPPPPDHAELRRPGQTLVGYVGAFVPYHGVEYLVEIAACLRKRRPDCRWLLVGDGVMRARVEEELDERGLRDLFLMPGAVRHEEVPGYVSLMDVCVMPKSNPHGSPMKVFEYMAMGKPAVAPRLGPLQEVIRDGENGFLFEPDDLGDIERKIDLLLGDDELRRRAGAQARHDILAHHTWEANTRQFLRALALDGCAERAAKMGVAR